MGRPGFGLGPGLLLSCSRVLVTLGPVVDAHGGGGPRAERAHGQAPESEGMISKWPRRETGARVLALLPGSPPFTS